MSKIEEVARAIGGDVWESCSDRMKEQFRAQARAAIEAMREPSDGMTEFASYHREEWSRSCLQSAIDAALAEGPLSPQSTG